MPEQVIRFAVTDNAGNRAEVWRVWSPSGSNDVYMTCRPLGYALKASLHESGRWRVAYTEEQFKKLFPGAAIAAKDRVIEKWSRPPVIAPGVTLAYRIVTLHSSVNIAVEASDSRQTKPSIGTIIAKAIANSNIITMP